ncbi:protein involved in gliding motility GldG [Mariniphaga anaerophila]|uniref:Protein involved in gliding motility GldG n=1 Tax=Mariniphaga anaerophila TaxID=1484053 RepID=A0A1M4XQV9_9BACT|nr:gliding motility-associated ABC transporter substrate-binding protein GldG [Mariniphaga anaerophila]SHE95821.1 protein involved in gliding motility GldG [Mariniphaga anaerophila]
MYSLFKKEIKTFFGSLIGYLAILVFLLVTGMFLWVFPGAYNIPDNGYATLEGFFSLAPWLYLFLIPAITMRFFAEEKRTGTLEILLTRPLSDLQLIFAKFMAGMVLVIFSLLPTLLYFLSVYLLGNPIGSIDTGATWGSFFGLFFLAAIYLAIGIFASSLTDNQIVSFILAMALSFVFYLGFDFIATSGIPYILEQIFGWLSISNHYLSASRGVIDLRDLIYFTGMTFLFLWFTRCFLRKGTWRQNSFRISSSFVVFILLIVFLISGNVLYRFDLTSDKRYSLSNISAELATELDHPVEIEFYLAGKLEPGLRKLQQEVFEKIAVLNVYAPKKIRLRITDPYAISNPEKREKFTNDLIKKGIQPTSFRQQTNQGVSSKLIFPGAVVRYNGKETAVNFLKYNPDFSHEANFNHSAESVEFELANAFQKLMRTRHSTVAFLEGQGEADRYQVYDFASALAEDFRVTQISTDSLAEKSDKIDVLIIANPTEPFSEKDKFYIDQFIMKGGKTLWLVDPVQVSLDSLSTGYQTLAFPRNLNLGDQLFRYGVRLNYELLQDVECARLRVNTAPPGTPPQFTLHPWYYSPLLVPSDNHPLSRNLNRVFTEFVSSIDTITGNPQVQKEIILSSSPYARRVKSPSTVSLKNIDNPPARELFNQSFIPVGALLEGTFTSVFKNRMLEALGIPDTEIIPESQPTKMVVIADGGIITNQVDYSGNPPRFHEMGFDRVSGQTFGNKEFLLNTVYYLNDNRGIMQLRNRNQKLRLLDKVRLREEKPLWQWLNVLLPLAVIALWGIAYNFMRNRRYSRS